jgi:hypothetical protein
MNLSNILKSLFATTALSLCLNASAAPIPNDPQKIDNNKNSIVLQEEQEQFHWYVSPWGIHLIPDNYFKEFENYTKNNEPLFTDNQIVKMYIFGVEAEYFKNVIDIYDNFDSIDYLNLALGNVPPDYIRGMHLIDKYLTKKNYDGFTIKRYYQLDQDLEDMLGFMDTEKPNALFIYPTDDHNGAFETPSAIELYKELKKEYDVELILADTEDPVYEALEKIPNIELLVLGGHGSQKSLHLGKIVDKENREKYFIDTEDIELKDYLANLTSDATIYLMSCSNAKGGENAENLANYVASISEERTVIASKEPFAIAWVELKDKYPLELQINNQEGEDVTYVTR